MREALTFLFILPSDFCLLLSFLGLSGNFHSLFKFSKIVMFRGVSGYKKELEKKSKSVTGLTLVCGL